MLPKDSYIYYIDMEVFADAIARLRATEYQIDSTSTDSHLTGTVSTIRERQLMFTSIPFDEGWNIYVDGEKVEIYEANNSLVAFYIDGAGEHTVEMKYMPATIALGITVSITCLIVFLVLLIIYPFIKRIPYLRKLVMIEGEELPALVTDEYMAEIEPGDIGGPDLVEKPFKKAKMSEDDAKKSKNNDRSTANNSRKGNSKNRKS